MTHLNNPNFDEVIENQMDISNVDCIEITVRNDRKVVWINLNGVCVVRICNIKQLIVDKEIK